ncbi:helix-turn-helix transcriptional regulator [Endozoicomonas sp. SM1973]|uniref:Helix-turn-helix transcriptional regulator n=1 Tax=Spartinivicinus marinus TaxID=2994442 RepID=A0A853IDE0_9GAMM|nr:helix-turn-helix transcriptional regulator [Spartinivicinus marinus]MCX4027089.1 helix-turn-helix transcriptional regulator [Spartinivicinus marinus]NYZ68568.1 helix-turn-helix transcriptional regulator [Spartinivicinus marinus]
MSNELDFSIQAIVRDKASHTPSHAHKKGQIFAIFSGLMTVTTQVGIWSMPPGRLGWVPPHCCHSAETHGPVNGFSIHIDQAKSLQLPGQPTVMGSSALMKALVERLVAAMKEKAIGRPECRVLEVLIDEIIRTKHESLLLPMPVDERLAKMASAIINEPSNHLSLDEWAEKVNMSRRTLTRHFKAETGLSFGQWRLQAKLHQALHMLSKGCSVTQVAFELGYNSVSAFTHSFKKVLGVTPSGYFSGINY